MCWALNLIPENAFSLHLIGILEPLAGRITARNMSHGSNATPRFSFVDIHLWVKVMANIQFAYFHRSLSLNRYWRYLIIYSVYNFYNRQGSINSPSYMYVRALMILLAAVQWVGPAIGLQLLLLLYFGGISDIRCVICRLKGF